MIGKLVYDLPSFALLCPLFFIEFELFAALHNIVQFKTLNLFQELIDCKIMFVVFKRITKVFLSITAASRDSSELRTFSLYSSL